MKIELVPSYTTDFKKSIYPLADGSTAKA